MATIERRIKALEDAQTPKTGMAALMLLHDDDQERRQSEYIAQHGEPEQWVFIRISGVKPRIDDSALEFSNE